MKKKIADNKKTIASNFFSLTILQAANYILPLLVLPFLVRTLGSEKFGLVMFAQSITTFLIVASDFGFQTSGTREVSLLRSNRKQLSEIFSAIITIKFILFIVCFIILFLIVELIPKLKENSIVYYLSFGSVIGNSIFPVWFFQGIEKMKFVTGINILSKVIFTLLIFFVIKNESDYYLVPAFNSIGFIIGGFLGLLLALKSVNLIKPKTKLMKRLLFESFSLFLGKLSSNLYANCNILILGFFAGNTIVGVYSSMEKLILAIKNIYMPFYQALFPWLSKQDPNKRSEVIKKIAPYVSGVGILIMLLILFFGERILILIYDDPLISSYAVIFKILSLIAVLAGLNMMFISLYLIAAKMYKTRMYILIFVGFSHLLISLVLVKFYNIYGIAIGLVFTEFLMLILGFYFYRKTLNIQNT